MNEATTTPREDRSAHWTRRGFLGATLPWLAACTTPLPLVLPREPSRAERDRAAARLMESANTHGLDAYRRLHDINIAYAGQWRPLIGRVQPDVVDPAYRGSSEERMLPGEGVTAQVYRGAAGTKKVLWQRGPDPRSTAATASTALGSIAVWRNDVQVDDDGSLGAAALVAECYALFLLGPLWMVDRGTNARFAGSETVDGRLCDVVEADVRPGFGRVAFDRVAACIDREDRITRRVRFTLEATANTRGAVAETDTFDHERRFGVLWPMRSHERVVHPFRLPAHDWHIAGLDVNRGYGLAELAGPGLTGRAAAPATAI